MTTDLTNDEIRFYKASKIRRFLLEAGLTLSIIASLASGFILFSMPVLSFDTFINNFQNLMVGLLFFLGICGVLVIKGVLLSTFLICDAIRYVRISATPNYLNEEGRYDKFSALFCDIARELIHKRRQSVEDTLVENGWPRIRAQFFVTFTYQYMMAHQLGGMSSAGDINKFVENLEEDGWREEWIFSALDPITRIYRKAGGIKHIEVRILAVFLSFLYITLLLSPLLLRLFFRFR